MTEIGRIGVLLTCYNCEEYVDACVDPWLSLKDEYNFVIAANSGMFKDYLHLGIKENNEGTLKKLMSKKLDFLVTTSGSNLLDEDYSRDVCLDFLKGGRWGRGNSCDLLIVIDGDEIFTEGNIRNIIEYVRNNPNHEGYRISFKNHTFRKGLFINYIHDRIFWMNRQGGINRFYFDNRFEYVDHATGLSEVRYSDSCEIPKSVAFVDHYSWLENDPRTLDKIKYQNLRYHGINNEVPENVRCSYEWNHETSSLQWNKKFYHYRNLEIPVVHEIISPEYTFDFNISFRRNENRIYIENINRKGTVEFIVYNDINEKLHSCFFNLEPNIFYWILPTVDNLEKNGVRNITIIAKENEQIIHAEKFHLIH
jgi:hypothetical protein